MVYFRLIVEFLPVTFAELAIWFHIWGLVTMIYGGAMALMQDDLKRFLAYSSISQMGYLAVWNWFNVCTMVLLVLK